VADDPPVTVDGDIDTDKSVAGAGGGGVGAGVAVGDAVGVGGGGDPAVVFINTFSAGDAPVTSKTRSGLPSALTSAEIKDPPLMLDCGGGTR
jgi:hypothetical protein